MKRWFVSVMATFALLVLPLAGCSGSSNGGTGGTAGSGGASGAGGTAGIGGVAGGGGDGGSGGNGMTANQSWSGTGDGEDGPFTICLTVNEDGSALVDDDGACGWSFAVVFQSCDTTPNEWARFNDIPIVDGEFSFSSSRGEINGTFAGDTASGDVRVGSCTGTWMATPDR